MLTLVGGTGGGVLRSTAALALGIGLAALAAPCRSEGAADSPREQATAAAVAVSSVQASRARIAGREMARLTATSQEFGQAAQRHPTLFFIFFRYLEANN
jgi:hypothetical protein